MYRNSNSVGVLVLMANAAMIRRFDEFWMAYPSTTSMIQHSVIIKTLRHPSAQLLCMLR